MTEEEFTRWWAEGETIIRRTIWHYVVKLKGERLGALDVNDLTQEVGMRCWSKRHRFTYGGQESFIRWAKAIAYTVFINKTRCNIGKALPPGFNPWEIDGPAAPDEIGAVEDADEVLPLVEAIRTSIPSHYWDLLRGVYLEEKTYLELGAIVGCPKGTVASRLSRAKTEARKVLEARGLTTYG